MNTLQNHPSDGSIPSQALHHKEEGSRQFATNNFEGARDSYLAALQHFPCLVWSQHETFVLALHSNLALVYLKTNQPDKAVYHTTTAQNLPIFQVHATDALREKVLVRHVEALLAIGDKNRCIDIWKALDELQARGYLSKSSNMKARRILFRLGGQAAALAKNVGNTPVLLALQAWTDHLMRVQACTLKQALQARKEYETKQANIIQDTDPNELVKRQESLALEALSKIFPVPKCSMEEVCIELMMYIQTGEKEMALATLRNVLRRDSGLHPSSIDEELGGYMLWINCNSLLKSHAPKEVVDIFLLVLQILVDEHGVSVNQRAVSYFDLCSRTPLQYVVKSGCPKAVKAMIDRGANVNLRDDQGWTALHSICMNDIAPPAKGGPSPQDRVETARLLVDAGAEIDPENSMGMTPLLTLCTQPEPELLEFLLVRGADPHRCNHRGWGTIFLLAEAIDNSHLGRKCRKILDQHMTSNMNTDVQEGDKVITFKKLMREVIIPVNNAHVESNTSTLDLLVNLRQRAQQERAVLSALMKHVSLDPALLSRSPQPRDGNWLEQLHSAVLEMIPAAFLKLYRESPSKRELALMMATSAEVQVAQSKHGNTDVFDQEMAKNVILRPFRQRGHLYSASLMKGFRESVVDAAQHCISFAIPNSEILEKIALCGPIVEVGAGTGYWSAVLKSQGVDVMTYDKFPPKADHSGSMFFDQSYTTVLQGDATLESFWTTAELSRRTLLMVWPDNADKWDNPHLYHGEATPPIWDFECLMRYINCGGQTVIYVGEREDAIITLPNSQPDCGVCSTRRFQQILKEHFDLTDRVMIPTWYIFSDDATIWKRKQGKEAIQ